MAGRKKNKVFANLIYSGKIDFNYFVNTYGFVSLSKYLGLIDFNKDDDIIDIFISAFRKTNKIYCQSIIASILDNSSLTENQFNKIYNFCVANNENISTSAKQSIIKT